MKIFFFIFLLIYSAALVGQPSSFIQINDTLTAHQYEFSALAKWKNKILLVPQNRKNVIDSVYMIDSLAIEESLQKNIAAAYTGVCNK